MIMRVLTVEEEDSFALCTGNLCLNNPTCMDNKDHEVIDQQNKRCIINYLNKKQQDAVKHIGKSATCVSSIHSNSNRKDELED